MTRCEKQVKDRVIWEAGRLLLITLDTHVKPCHIPLVTVAAIATLADVSIVREELLIGQQDRLTRSYDSYTRISMRNEMRVYSERRRQCSPIVICERNPL